MSIMSTIKRIDSGAPLTRAPRNRLGRPPLTGTKRAAYGLVGTLAIVVLAEAAIRLGLLDERYVPPPSVLINELGSLIAQSSFWISVGQTLAGWGFGLLLAATIAIPLAVLIVSVDVVDRALRPIIEFLRPVPSVALIPVAILLFGVGSESKLFLVTFGAIWPLLIQTVIGLRDIDPTQLTTAKSYRVPRSDLILRVILPNAMPYIATGARIASTTALIVTIVAELIIGSAGLGRDISFAQASNATVTMYALIMTTGFLGLILNLLVLTIERRLLRWHPSHREVIG